MEEQGTHSYMEDPKNKMAHCIFCGFFGTGKEADDIDPGLPRLPKSPRSCNHESLGCQHIADAISEDGTQHLCQSLLILM